MSQGHNEANNYLNTEDNLIINDEPIGYFDKPKVSKSVFNDNDNEEIRLKQKLPNNKHLKIKVNRANKIVAKEYVEKNERYETPDRSINNNNSGLGGVNKSSFVESFYESANSSLNLTNEIPNNKNNIQSNKIINEENKQTQNYFSEDSSSYYSETNSNKDDLDLNHNTIYQNQNIISEYIKERNFEKLNSLEYDISIKIINKRKSEYENKLKKINQRVEKIKDMTFDNNIKRKLSVEKEKSINLYLANTNKEQGGLDIIEESEFNKHYKEDTFCEYNLYYEKQSTADK